MDAITYIVPGQMAYSYIPTTELRQFTDGLFPTLAKNKLADSTTGMGSTPLPRTVLKRLYTQDHAWPLSVAFADYESAQCNRTDPIWRYPLSGT